MVDREVIAVHKTHKYTVWTECRMLNVQRVGYWAVKDKKPTVAREFNACLLQEKS
jgi:hypothetical protein